jgi:Cysteine sulfinate desulfinase/cysteine desulfurase and related enzymes
MQIYLDNSATTKCCEAAQDAVLQTMCEDYFNPAAMYKPAVDVEKRVETARREIAAEMGADAADVFFVSGGTEADNIVICGGQNTARKGISRMICGPSEHPAVFRCFEAMAAQGHDVQYLHCNAQGDIDPDELAELVDETTRLVSVMHVNNEFGTVADLAALRTVIRKRNPETVFHSDGVQAFGHLPSAAVEADAYSISGHKFHAPKGIGALLLRKGRVKAQGALGGAQESGLRAGTLNVPGICGMAAALYEWKREGNDGIERIRQMKLRLAESLLSLPDVLVNGPSLESGAPHIVNLSFLGVRGEVLLHALEEKGIYVSTGSACSSKKRGKNRVLASIGVEDGCAESAVRFSLGRFNTMEEMDATANAIAELLPMLRRFRPR